MIIGKQGRTVSAIRTLLNAASIEGDVGSENNMTKCTIHTKVETCLDNQDLMLPEPYIMLWAGE
jgi:hypothetical protein